MGIKLIIKGADFSENGVIVSALLYDSITDITVAGSSFGGPQMSAYAPKVSLSGKTITRVDILRGYSASEGDVCIIKYNITTDAYDVIKKINASEFPQNGSGTLLSVEINDVSFTDGEYLVFGTENRSEGTASSSQNLIPIKFATGSSSSPAMQIKKESGYVNDNGVLPMVKIFGYQS